MERPSYVIKLDMIDTGVVDTSVRIKQGDSGSIIYLKVYNNGNEYYNEDILPDVYFRRPDGSTVIGSAISGTLNMYVYSIVGNELEIPGTIIMDVKFKLESGRESTASCKFECVQDTLGDSVSSSDIYWNDAAEILKELDASIAIAEPLIESGNDVVSELRPLVESGQSIIDEIAEDVEDARTYSTTASEASETATSKAQEATEASASATASATSAETSATNASTSATNAKSDADRAEAAAKNLKPATTSSIGLVKPDGTSITVDSDGTIHGSASVDIATTTKAGIVKPDGETITVDEDGTIHGSSSVDVIDNLNSTSSTDALSAKQGKVLNENKADKTELPTITNTSNTTFTLDTSKGGIGVNKVVGKSVKTDDGIFSSGSMGLVDLGTLTWEYRDYSSRVFFATITDLKLNGNGYCNSYQKVPNNSLQEFSNSPDKSFAFNNTAYNQVYIRNDSCTNVTELTSALQGVLLAYELADGATPSQYAEVVEEHGKNICYKSNTNTTKNAYLYVDKEYVEKNISLSFTSNGNHNGNVYLRVDDTSLGVVGSSSATNNKTVATFSLSDENIEKIKKGNTIVFDIYNSGGNLTYISNAQVEIGTSATDYIPYQSNTSIIPLSSQLRSVGDIHDEIDVENKQLIRRVGSVDLGSLTWNYNSSSHNAKLPTDSKHLSTGSRDDTGMICEKYITSVSGDDKTYFKYWDNTNTWVCIYDSSYTDATTFKSAMNGVMLYYELATPTTTQLTDEQLNALLSLVSYDGKTYIDTSDVYAKATLDIDYSKSNIGSLALQNENDVVELRNDVDKNTSDISSLNDTMQKKTWTLVYSASTIDNNAFTTQDLSNYTEICVSYQTMKGQPWFTKIVPLDAFQVGRVFDFNTITESTSYYIIYRLQRTSANVFTPTELIKLGYTAINLEIRAR